VNRVLNRTLVSLSGTCEIEGHLLCDVDRLHLLLTATLRGGGWVKNRTMRCVVNYNLSNKRRAGVGGSRRLVQRAGPEKYFIVPTRSAKTMIVTWLILPVVICLSQRLSHACLSINKFIVKLRMAH
jgi:hypothetical protein